MWASRWTEIAADPLEDGTSECRTSPFMKLRLLGPLAATALTLPLISGCSSDSPTATRSSSIGTPTSSVSSASGAKRTSACKPVPAPSGEFDWLPADLPLPPGTYATADTESPSTTSASDTDAESGAVGSAQRGFLVVKVTVDDFKKFVTTNWPAAGYSLGKGDAEAGEAEGGYRKGDFGGVYRVRDVYCDPTMSELLLTYGKGV